MGPPGTTMTVLVAAVAAGFGSYLLLSGVGLLLWACASLLRGVPESE